MSSLHIDRIVELPADLVATSFLAFPGLRLVQVPQSDWWAWQARWESGGDFIDVGFTLLEGLGDIWGGSSITAHCPSSALLALLSHMTQRHHGIWLHDPQCGMHAYEHFPETC
ncbi:MAG TPA: hypothetical protein VF585_01515 [Chthoniobacterales bacterium]|jgi:hypothetical protein